MVSVGWSLRRSRGLFVLLVLGLLAGWVVGCTQFNAVKPVNTDADPATTKDASLEITPADDGTTATSCGLNYLTGAERDAAIQAALNDPKVQSIQQELSNRGFTLNTQEALAFTVDGEKLVYLPAGENASIVAETYLNKWYAVGLIKEGDKTINIKADRGVRHITGFDPKTRAKLFKSLHNNKQIKTLEKTLKGQNQRIDWNKSVLIVDTESNKATVGLAIRATDNLKPAWFGYRVDATMQGGRKLVVQDLKAEACGSLASAAQLTVQPNGEVKPQFVDGGEPDPGASYSQNQVCVSNWGYNYYCFNSTAQFGVSISSAQMLAFMGQSPQVTFTIWNYSNKTMTGTATTAAPFSIVSGGSFTLAAGQPQPVTVKFSPTTAGGFSGNVTLKSGTLVQNLPLAASTLSISPSQLNVAQLSYVIFLGYTPLPVPNDGSCVSPIGGTGCGGSLPPDPTLKKFTIKNDGPASWYDAGGKAIDSTISVNVSTAAPFGLLATATNPFALKGGESREVTIKFNPTTSGNFTGNVAIDASLGTTTSASTQISTLGIAHKITVDPGQLTFLAITDDTSGQIPTRTMKVTNVGVTTAPLTLSVAAPFYIVPSGGSPTSTMSFTLAPNQSSTITVQFKPTATGKFFNMASLTSGASMSIPLGGAAYTKQDLLAMLQSLLGAQNQACDALENVTGKPSYSGYLPIPKENADGLIYGFHCLPQDQASNLIRLCQVCSVN